MDTALLIGSFIFCYVATAALWYQVGRNRGMNEIIEIYRGNG